MNILDQIDIPPPDERVWSPFQHAIFEAVRQPQDLIIQAVAGSGKTTTIIKAMEYSPGSSLFMAFNKSIAEDIRKRATSGEVRTLNAMGHSLVMANRPKASLNARKMTDCVEKVMGKGDEFREWGYTLGRICGIAKNCCFGIGSEIEAADFIDLIDNFAAEIPSDRISDFSFICREAFELSRLDESTFDFDDQLWLPVYHNWTFPSFSNVFVDECQDLSPIQHMMLERFKARGARIVAVGDRHQAIYGFRGASHDSMDILKGKFGMLELPLSVSYRCPKLVVEAARQFCPTIEWRDGAPDGELHFSDIDPQSPKGFERYMILCRNNAPMFAEILRHVRAKAPCQVMSNFLDSFQSFVRGFKARYTSDLIAKLDNWYDRESAAARATGKKGKLRALSDKYHTVRLLALEHKETEEIINLVKSLGYSKRGPIFATVHKSKGLEHPHIYLLRPDLFGGFGDLSAAQRQQEDNLHYVAITRSQSTLTYGATSRG